MWSQIALFFVVSLAYASTSSPAWKQSHEYVYEIRGRSLASLHGISDDYSGIVIKAKLIVRPKSEDTLDAKITDAQYAQVHAKLQGWTSHIPESELSYKDLPISPKPFQIVMVNGALRDILVSPEIPNWDANMIKSIVSQLQLDTNNENLIPSHYNVLTHENTNTAVFKTMEETVTGVAETLYELNYFPEHALESSPWLVPRPHLKGNGDIFEIMKTKNYSRAEQRPSYHFGFNHMDDFEPATGQMGEFFTRMTNTRAIITGTLDSYAIQSSVTYDKIRINPAPADKQKGSVDSMVNITLLSVEPSTEQFEPISSPVSVSLVYRFDLPYALSNKAREGIPYEHNTATGSAEAHYSAPGLDYEENFLRNKRGNVNVQGRDVVVNGGNDINAHFGLFSFKSSEQPWDQSLPTLTSPPESPLLPFTVGYEGQSLKKQQNVVENARKLAQQIGQEIQTPEAIPQKSSIGKFVVLSSLLRIMNVEEIQKVAAQLYTADHKTAQGAAWTAYRDALAQAGTGPALVSVEEWISSKKIQGEEAAHVISILAHATRQPTTEYMKKFFKLVKLEQIKEQPHLNETAILAYTRLAHQVYVDAKESHNRYPVHSFTAFRTKEGYKLLTNEIIPYLTEKLHDAIAKTETKKIHVYIRALGNVGEQRMLEAFEPYLEGKKQASHFQRILMVAALDKLANSNPKVARSVLYKVYQNPSEYQQVRVAAVYQLMRTNPAPDMLQRMALYTNVDTSEYVNAAVKSVIESAANLLGSEQAKLRKAAQSAKPLLTSKTYGAQYSKGFLRSYVVEETNQAYKQTFETYGAEDSFWARGVKYSLRKSMNGVSERMANAQALISSFDDLISVVERQTAKYHENLEQKRASRDDQHQWSPVNIAKLLNINNEQRDQLEGNFHFQMGALQHMLSFDNQTIENLPYALRELEEALKTGKDFFYQQFINSQESALAFPTILGLPFLYTYDRPTLIRVEGKLRANANPSVSSGGKLHMPQIAESQYEINALLSGRSQSQLAFITPFDSQKYSAGYDKNFQLYAPLSGSIAVDFQQQQVKTEIKPLSGKQNLKFLHYSSWPYTAKDNIYSPEPNKRIIRRETPQKINTVFGHGSTGIALNVQASMDRPMDFAQVYEKLQRHDFVSAILSPWVDENIQHTEITVGIDSSKTSTTKVAAQFGYQHSYQRRRLSDRNEGAHISKFGEISEEPIKRQIEFMKRAGADINSVHARVLDVTVGFAGQQTIKYVASITAAKSNVDEKSRVLVQFKKNGGEGKQLHAFLSAKSQIPNTNGLDLTYAMQADTTITTEIEASIGENYQSGTKFSAKFQHQKSQERQEYLKQLPEYKQCQREMQQGNKQLPACAKMTVAANLLDKFSAKIQYQNMQPRIVNETYHLYNLLRHAIYPRVEENMVDPQGTGRDEVEIQGQFSTDLKAVNATIKTKHVQVHIKDVKLHPLAQQLFVPHPVFHVRARVLGSAYGYEAYRPFCTVDKQAISTFDNKTYETQLPSEWTVLLHYGPNRAQHKEVQNLPSKVGTVHEQLKNIVENYAVLSRAAPGSPSQKEVKFSIQTPQTMGKLVQITFKPASPLPKVFIGNEEIKYSGQQGADIYDGYLQIYSLPNGELKAELHEAFYMIYDGERVKLTIVDNKFKDSTRGLCGTFTGEQESDFMSPGNCIIPDIEEFVESYVIPDGPSHPIAPGPCYYKQVRYANVISSMDAGRLRSGYDHAYPKKRSSCSKLQTQFVAQGDEICFTLKTLPVCKPGCQRKGTVTKTVAVHCVQQSGATQLWVNQIKQGANPDFSMKSQTKTIQIEVPQSCSA